MDAQVFRIAPAGKSGGSHADEGGGKCGRCAYRTLCLPLGLSERDLARVEAAIGCRRRLVRGDVAAAGHEALSNRELEVFKLIALGEPLVQIGEKLHLSPNTVTTYRARILDKMGMSSNAELTRYALEHGIIR